MRFAISCSANILLRSVEALIRPRGHKGHPVSSVLRPWTSVLSYPINRPLVTSPVIKADAEFVELTFRKADGSLIKTQGKIGDNFLDVVVNNSVDLDGFGACEGTLACSTCHLVFKKEDFDKIKDKITDEELDMLDMAYGLTDTSRLGCQVTITKELAGVEVSVPEGVADARS